MINFENVSSCGNHRSKSSRNAFQEAGVKDSLQMSSFYDLYVAIMTKDKEKLREEVKEKSSLGFTPLSHAAANGFPLDAIHRLCEAGSDLNAMDSYGKTAILFSALYGECDI